MNARRGLKRLAVAVGVPWFGFWAFVYWANYGRANDPYGGEAQYADASYNMALAIWLGVGMPILLVSAIAAAVWVYRGFNPKP